MRHEKLSTTGGTSDRNMNQLSWRGLCCTVVLGIVFGNLFDFTDLIFQPSSLIIGALIELVGR